MIKVNYKRSFFNFINKFLPLTRLFSLKRWLANICGIEISNGTNLSSNIKFIGLGRIVIGKNCYVGTGTVFIASSDCFIGDNVNIAPYTLFHCGSHHIGSKKMRAGKGISKNIRINNGCWIGARTTILGGVYLKEGCVIGACSLVLSKENYESNSLYAGVPASFKKLLN